MSQSIRTSSAVGSPRGHGFATGAMRHSGQAMVEFVILLTIIMTLCAGMLYSSRLLTFEFWAQQEARYIAFEQTWVPSMWRTNEAGAVIDDPIGELDNGAFLHRPELVGELEADKDINNDDGVTELISGAYASLRRVFSPEESTDGVKEAPVMVASTGSIWDRRTSTWFESEPFELLQTAHATQSPLVRRRVGGTSFPDNPRQAPRPRFFYGESPLEGHFVRLMKTVGFGERFCGAANNYLAKQPMVLDGHPFAAGDCAERFDRDFGIHIARNLDYKEFFRDYEYQLDWGLGAQEALEVTAERAIANQFYSFFDDAVSVMFSVSVPYIVGGRLSTSAELADESITRMLADLRYIGSSAAIGAIIAAFSSINWSDPGNQSSDIAKELEDTLTDILHVDAANLLPVIGNGFLLSPEYLPVPPTFGPFAGGLFSGPMRAVLSKEADSLETTLIDQSNKMAEVSYHADRGLFPAARRRWDTSGKVLTSRFYLVTQEWHIPRREGRTGDWRDKGTQDDDLDLETEEAILRRRVFGLWLIPTPLSAFLEPILGAVSGTETGDVMEAMFGALEVLDGFVSLIKDFIADNPFLDLIEGLSEIPGIGSFIPTLPEWPAVRPEAYPGSVEMQGDRMSGSVRSFPDYIEEQHNNNPEPDPEFN